MSSDSENKSGTGSFIFVALLSSIFAALLGAGSGFGTSVGFAVAGLVMPVLSPLLLTAILFAGEPWQIVDSHFLPRAVLAAAGILTSVLSVVLMWRGRNRIFGAKGSMTNRQ